MFRVNIGYKELKWVLLGSCDSWGRRDSPSNLDYPEEAHFGKAYLQYRRAALKNLSIDNERCLEVTLWYSRGRLGCCMVLSTHGAVETCN